MSDCTLFNPKANPRCVRLLSIIKYLAVPNSLVSFDTVEVCGSSPHGPTIFFSELASTTSLGKAPIGSIKDVVRNCQGHFLIVLREETGFV